jgi:hypothetical protein
MKSVVYYGNLPPPPPVVNARLLSSNDNRKGIIAEHLADAEQLVILDPMSFPYELMDDEHRNIPVVVKIPAEPDDEIVSLVLGEPLLSDLTPFDTIILDDFARHDFYRMQYRVASTQVISRWARGGLGEFVSRPDLSETTSAFLLELGHDPIGWNIPSRENKAKHRLQTKVLHEILSERRDFIAPQNVLLVGKVSPRLLRSLPESIVSVASILDLGTEAIGARAVEWPSLEARTLGPKLRFPPPQRPFDLVALPWVYSSLECQKWEFLTSELVRVSRPGGLIVIVDRFVPRQPDLPVIAANELLNHLADETHFSFRLRDLRSMTYSHDQGPSDAVLILTAPEASE